MSVNRRAWKSALWGMITLWLVAAGVILLASLTLPEPAGPPSLYSVETMERLEDQNVFSRYILAPWYRWDTVNYLAIADEGYRSDLRLTVWPPLYPLLIRGFTVLTGESMLAALLISQLATLLFFYLFYRFCAETWNEDVARRAVSFIAAFPTAFFLIAGYTEALFLLLALLSIHLARKGKWWGAGIAAFAAAMTRNTGVFLALPLAWEGLMAWRKAPEQRWKIILQTGFACALPVIGFAGFAAWVHFGLGTAYPWQTLQSEWQQYVGLPWEGWVNAAVGLAKGSLPPPYNGFSVTFDLLLGLLAAITLVVGTKKLPVSLSLFGWVTLLSALTKLSSSGAVISLSRYALSVFPMFIVLGLTVKKPGLRLAWMAVSLACQAILLLLYYGWGWVA
ncbi:MAG: glycosyltransferase family 39 protein [Anaerolineaceae bacterium]